MKILRLFSCSIFFLNFYALEDLVNFSACVFPIAFFRFPAICGHDFVNRKETVKVRAMAEVFRQMTKFSRSSVKLYIKHIKCEYYKSFVCRYND